MPKPNDLHHLAIATADIKTQIEFFSDVLGMELVALYWMHGADGCFHGFLKLHDTASVAFVREQQASYQGDGKKDARHLALTDFCQVLMDLNEFIYVE